jgi:hypothetical protein
MIDFSMFAPGGIFHSEPQEKGYHAMNTSPKIRCQEMIIALFPSARPGVDFDLVEDSSGRVDVSMWNEITLGKPVPMCHLRQKFMEYLERKQRVIPTLDMSDPCPWLKEDEPSKDVAAAPRSAVSEKHSHKIYIVR